jgi:excisionase family DNA binding protein
MENETQFYTTSDIRRILGIGNKTCLDLFHRKDFPCIKFGKSFLISVSAFNEYVSTRRVFNETH